MMVAPRFGICEWALPYGGPEACRLAKECGLEGVEIELGPYERGWPLSNPVIRRAYAQARDETGVVFPSIAVNCLCEYGMTSYPGGHEGAIVRHAIEKAVETAIVLAIPLIQLPSFEKGAIESESDFRNTADCLALACELTASSGISIGAENTLSAAETLHLIDTVGSPNLKVFFDTQNYFLLKGYEESKLVDDLAEYIVEVHAKDGIDGMSESMLGEGASGFVATIAALKRVGFRGWMHLENYYDRGPLLATGLDPFEMLKSDLETLKRLFANQADYHAI